MLEWWYRFTAPPDVAPDAAFVAREQARRGRLASVLALGFVIAELVVLIAGLHDSIHLPSPFSCVRSYSRRACSAGPVCPVCR